MKSTKNHDKTQETMFSQKFLNSQAVVTLVIILLILLIIFMFTKIGYLFAPLGQVFNLLAFPVIMAGVLYYLLYPLVNYLALRGIDRRISIWAIFIITTLLGVWGIMSLIPVLERQGETFITNMPTYYKQIETWVNALPLDVESNSVFKYVEDFINGIDVASLTDRLNAILQSTFGGLGSFLGTVAEIVAGLLTMPILLYYLLLHGGQIPMSFVKYVPSHYQGIFTRILYRSSHQISQYIRGQILVAIIVAFMFLVGYTLIGLDYGLSLAIIAGFLNIIPYIGSIIAVIPALILAALTSPYMVLKVLIVIFIEQFVEGRFVSPQVLGSNMDIHPMTILFVLLIAGRLYGLFGVILGVPVFAIMKVISSEIYNNFRKTSDFYADNRILNSQAYRYPQDHEG